MKILSTLLLFSLTFNLFSQISNEGLLAYYPFDNHVLDLGPNGFNGTLSGGSFSENEDGNINSALSLNGIDDFLNISNFANTFRGNTSLMTIYYKIRFQKQGSEQTILSLGSYGENMYTNVFEIEYENNRLQVETETGNSAINHELEIDQTLHLFDGQWHEIMIFLKEDSIIYCRDEEVIFKDIYVPSESISNKLFIGSFYGSGIQSCCFFGGDLDELQFYNRILDNKKRSTNNLKISIKDKIQVYPNPTISKLNIILDKEYKSLVVSLFDLHGRIIAKKEVNNLSEFHFDIPGPKGIYLLNIQSSTSEYANFKIVKLNERT